MGAEAFNQPLNNWNVAGVSNLQVPPTYAPAPPLAPPPSPRASEQSRVPSLSPHPQTTFSIAKAFNQPLDKWNVANVGHIHGPPFLVRPPLLRTIPRLANLAPRLTSPSPHPQGTFGGSDYTDTALSDENKALIASTWKASPAWCSSEWASWGEGCPSSAGALLGAIAGLVVVCAPIVVYMVKKWRRKKEHDRTAAADRGMPVPVPQAVAPAPMGMTTMQIVIPPTAFPGQTLQVAGPNGQPMSVAVPPGAVPGSTMMIQVPAPQQAVVTAATAVPMVATAVPMQQPAEEGITMGMKLS